MDCLRDDTSLALIAEKIGMEMDDLADCLEHFGEAFPPDGTQKAVRALRSFAGWFEETGYDGPPLQVLCWLASLELAGSHAAMLEAADVLCVLFAQIREIATPSPLDYGERMPWLWPPCEGVETPPEDGSALARLACAANVPWRLVGGWLDAIGDPRQRALARQALEGFGDWLDRHDIPALAPGQMEAWHDDMAHGLVEGMDPSRADALYAAACRWLVLPASLGFLRTGATACWGDGPEGTSSLRTLCAWIGVPLSSIDDWLAGRGAEERQEARQALADYAAWGARWLDRPVFMSLPYWLLDMVWKDRPDALPRAAVACSYFLWLERHGLYATRLPESVVHAGEGEAGAAAGHKPSVGLPDLRAGGGIAAIRPTELAEALYQGQRFALWSQEQGRGAPDAGGVDEWLDTLPDDALVARSFCREAALALPGGAGAAVTDGERSGDEMPAAPAPVEEDDGAAPAANTDKVAMDLDEEPVPSDAEDDGGQAPMDDESLRAAQQEAMEAQEARAAFAAAEGRQEEPEILPEEPKAAPAIDEDFRSFDEAEDDDPFFASTPPAGQEAEAEAPSPQEAAGTAGSGWPQGSVWGRKFDWGVPSPFLNERGLLYLCVLYGIDSESFALWRETLAYDGEGKAKTNLLVLLGRFGKWAAKELPGKQPGEEDALRWLAGLGSVNMDMDVLRPRTLHFVRWGLTRGAGGDARAALALHPETRVRKKRRPRRNPRQLLLPGMEKYFS